ncbi:MAG: hypothetical protein AAGK00_03500 [Pseudomonadota bacterium]
MSNAQPTVHGLTITPQRLDEIIARNVVLLRRGLDLEARFNSAADAQEATRAQAEAARAAKGEQPPHVPTDEETAWDAYHDRALTRIASAHVDVLDQFGLDPRKSVLFQQYPELMMQACDPQVPVLYSPRFRCFTLMETWGAAQRSIAHCPSTGKELPGDLSDAWFDLTDDLMGTDDWQSGDVRARLGDEHFTEKWWIKRGL